MSVMERFPQHQDVQFKACCALHLLCFYHPALKERAGELGAVEALVHALDRFAASYQGRVRYFGVGALRDLTDGLPANAARLEAAGGTHYLDVESSDEEGSEQDDSAEEDQEGDGAY